MRPALHPTAVTAVTCAAAALALGVAAPAQADPTFHTTKFPLFSVGGSTVTGSVIDIHTQGVRIYAQERYALRGAVPGTTYAVNLTAYRDAACTEVVLAVPDSPTATANRAGNASARRTFPFPGPGAGVLYLRWTVTGPGQQLVAQTGCVRVGLD